MRRSLPASSPHLKRTKPPATVAEALSAIERQYAAMPDPSPREQRQLYAFHTTCKRISEALKLPPECVFLDHLMDIDTTLISHIEALGIDHQTAIRYVANKNAFLDRANQFGWTCKAYELRKAWLPVRAALKGRSRSYTSIIEFAFKGGYSPKTFTREVMNAWKQAKLDRGRSFLFLGRQEWHWRATLRAAGLQPHFPKFSLASKALPKYRIGLHELSEPVRREILQIVHWKTADEDLEDRDASLMVRPVTGKNLLKYLLQLCGYAINELGIPHPVSLTQVLTEEIVDRYIEWLQKNGHCLPATIVGKLSGIELLTRTYPAFKGTDYGWFRRKQKALVKGKRASVQARKFSGSTPDYESLAAIPSKLLGFKNDLNHLKPRDISWRHHDALLYSVCCAIPHRSRNLREARINPHPRANIFETEIDAEMLTYFNLPTWAKEARALDPTRVFLVGRWREIEMKANNAVYEVFPDHVIPLFREYVSCHRPSLVGDTDPGTLFLSRTGTMLSHHSLLDLVNKISVQYTGKRMTVKLFRDVVAAHLLATGSELEDVQDRLHHLTSYTTDLHYMGAFNASDGANALDDEISALHGCQRP